MRSVVSAQLEANPSFVEEEDQEEGERMDRCSSSSKHQITFAKRRNSLLRKAEELSNLCDAQVGLIIFSCTGALYEYSSTSMDSIIERYNNLKLEHNQELDHPAIDSKVLQEEIGNLNQQLQALQEYNRQLMGEELTGLSIKDMQNLENQLEMSLATIRLKKEELMAEQIGELHRKRESISKENLELQEKASLIDNSELLEKIHRERSSSSEANRPYHISYGVDDQNDQDLPVRSRSRRLRRQDYKSAAPPITTELELRLPRPSDFSTQDDG